MGGRGSLRGDRAWGKGGVAGGLEQGSWGLGRVSKGLGGWGLERAEGLGSGGTVWRMGRKGGSENTIKLTYSSEISYSGVFSQKMTPSYGLGVSINDFCSIALYIRIKGESFELLYSYV